VHAKNVENINLYLAVSTCRVSVEIQNHSLRELTLTSKCKLYPVSIVDNLNSSIQNQCDDQTVTDTYLLFMKHMHHRLGDPSQDCLVLSR